MKKIFGILTGIYYLFFPVIAFGAEKFDILPDLPEPLAAAQASSVTTSASDGILPAASQSIGHEPNLISMFFTLIFVLLLIYITGIIYAKLNKFGLNAFRKQTGSGDNSKVSVVSTTPLGSNRTLHVVELDGKRMLIGASASSIQLIKDLGSYPSVDIEEGEFSKIEIPNIRIPKIEIPKIEFPNIGFTKTFKKNQISEDASSDSSDTDEASNDDVNAFKTDESDKFEISDIYEESPDGIIDKLFTSVPESSESSSQNKTEEEKETVHKVDPDEFALYKKYL